MGKVDALFPVMLHVKFRLEGGLQKESLEAAIATFVEGTGEIDGAVAQLAGK